MLTKKFLFLLCVVIVWLNVHGQKVPDSILIKNLMLADTANMRQMDQLRKELSDLKTQLQRQERQKFDKFIASSSFLDAAISSTNNLQSLVLKESYRNRIASLNNPTSNELGFNLEMEIQNALKPLLQKAKKTDTDKFGQVVQSFLETGKRSPVSLFPAGNVFTSIVGMVGSLTVKEKPISQEDLNIFIKSIEKYFNEYERLYQSNLQFNKDMEQIKSRLNLLQDDIRLLMQDLILSVDKTIKRQQLKSLSSEELMLRYFESKRISDLLNNSKNQIQFPQDAIKSCKEIANNIQRIYNDYTLIYNNNFKEIKSIISDTKNISPMVDQIQLNKTLKDLESLYTESKTMDSDNLRLKTLFDRLEFVIQ